MILQSHCWAYTLRKPELKEVRVPQCSFFKKQRTILNKFYFSTMKLLNTVTSQKKQNNVYGFFFFLIVLMVSIWEWNYCYPYSYFFKSNLFYSSVKFILFHVIEYYFSNDIVMFFREGLNTFIPHRTIYSSETQECSWRCLVIHVFPDNNGCHLPKLFVLIF